VQFNILGNDGSPLSLDVGLGFGSHFNFTIPPSGSRTFRSRIASPSIQTGWAIASSSIPLQATVLFSLIQNGIAQFQVSAPATLPSPVYWSSANNLLGIAIANPFSSGTANMTLQAIDSQGQTVSQTTLSLGAMQHTSFNASQKFPNLPTNFTGTVKIFGQTASDYFLAWTLNTDSGVLSSLPAGRAEWPVSHWERIWLVYQRVLDAAQRTLIPKGVDLTAAPAAHLQITFEQVINAFANSDGTVQINAALSELISDSPSELAFAVAHELGHIVQYKTGKLLFNANREFDADQYGLIFSLVAGFDPYAAAGTLAKLDMAYGQAGLLAQLFDNFSGDLHGSFNQRLAAIYNTISAVCSDPAYTSYCSAYKTAIHPNFPPSVPLGISPPSK
jgi:Zn-dependent protease with chaperone function